MTKQEKDRYASIRSKKKMVSVMFLCAAACACICMAAAVHIDHLRQRDGFLPGTKVNGADVSGLTPHGAAENITNGLGNEKVTIFENGKEVFTETLAGLGYLPNTDALEEKLTAICNGDKKDYWSAVACCARGHSVTSGIKWTLDTNKLREAFSPGCLSVPRKKGHDAYIEYNKEKAIFEIIPETPGTEVDGEALRDWLKEEVRSALKEKDGIPDGPLTASIPEALYQKPKITNTDKELAKELDELNHCAKGSITYTFGEKTETLSKEKYAEWLYLKDKKPAVHMSQVRKYVTGLAEKYDTRYLDRTFKTTGGHTVDIPAGLNEYGYTVDQEGESEQLASDILSGEDVKRDPVYIEANIWGNPYYLGRNGKDDLAGTYVEVSLDSQHMWYYKNGELIVESDVVTGDVTKGLGTASGAFPLAYKESPSILRGGTGKDRYETKVQYWMPFYEGQGLHDADWKTAFGGTQYIENGSHGCVNLPPEIAKILYENIEQGTAVIIY